MREIIFDTETTGFSPDEGDRLVEIGAIELIDRMPTGRTLQLYFNPERSVPAGAFGVHGLSDAFLADKPLFADRADDILEFFGPDCPLVAHNADFDFGFVNHELARCGRPPLPPERKVDTVAMARRRHPGAKNSLDALCTRYGVDRSHRSLHGALLDAELLAQVYIELSGGRQIGLDLAADAAATGESAGGGGAPVAIRLPRLFVASDAELARHAAFVAAMDKPLWLDGR